jgi:hypothetical protein
MAPGSLVINSYSVLLNGFNPRCPCRLRPILVHFLTVSHNSPVTGLFTRPATGCSPQLSGRPQCADSGSPGSNFQCLLWRKKALKIDFPESEKCPSRALMGRAIQRKGGDWGRVPDSECILRRPCLPPAGIGRTMAKAGVVADSRKTSSLI